MTEQEHRAAMEATHTPKLDAFRVKVRTRLTSELIMYAAGLGAGTLYAFFGSEDETKAAMLASADEIDRRIPVKP